MPKLLLTHLGRVEVKIDNLTDSLHLYECGAPFYMEDYYGHYNLFEDHILEITVRDSVCMGSSEYKGKLCILLIFNFC